MMDPLDLVVSLQRTGICLLNVCLPRKAPLPFLRHTNTIRSLIRIADRSHILKTCPLSFPVLSRRSRQGRPTRAWTDFFYSPDTAPRTSIVPLFTQ